MSSRALSSDISSLSTWARPTGSFPGVPSEEPDSGRGVTDESA